MFRACAAMVRPIRARLVREENGKARLVQVREDDKTIFMDQVEGDSNGWRRFDSVKAAIDYYKAHDPAAGPPDHTRTKFATLKAPLISEALSNGGKNKNGSIKRTGSYTDGKGA